MGPSKFNSKMAIITAMESITDDELKQYILDNLSTFEKGSKFTIFGGHHHSGPAIEKPNLENVHLAETDPKLSYNHHMVCIFHPYLHVYSLANLTQHTVYILRQNFIKREVVIDFTVIMINFFNSTFRCLKMLKRPAKEPAHLIVKPQHVLIAIEVEFGKKRI